MRYFFISFILHYFIISPIAAYSQQNSYRYEIGFKSENDVYLAIKQDRYYTNGLFLFFKKAIKPSEKDSLLKKIWGISVAQKIFNPHSGKIYNPYTIDRPFAGYLYGSANLQWLFKNEKSLKTELQFGFIGPSSFAEQTQNFYHKVFDFYDLSGWDYQVGNEFSVNTAVNYHQKIFRTNNHKYDISLPAELRLGNTFLGIKTGLLLRVGNLNPFYHSVSTGSNLSAKAEKYDKQSEFFFFLEPALDVVFYDATISGGMFSTDKDEITFDTKPFVLSQKLGVAYSKKRWNLGLSFIFKTREVKSTASSHKYGIVDVGYRFR